MYLDLLYGVVVTVRIFALSWLIAIPLMIGLSLVVRSTTFRSWRYVVGLVASIPFLVLLFWFHYPFQQIFNLVISPEITLICVMGLILGILGSGLILNEINIIDEKYRDMRWYLTIPKKRYYLRVMLPLAMRRMTPILLGMAIFSVHMTMFGSLIGAEELFRMSMRLNSRVLDPVAVFTVMGLLYSAICIPLFIAAAIANRKWRV